MSLKNVFKRKVGGTVAGNLLRGVAKNYTGGLLGNGAMMLRENEAQSDYQDRVEELAAGAASGVKAVNTKQSLQERLTEKAKGVAKFFAILLLPGVVIIGLIVYLVIKRKNKRSKWRR